MYRMGPTLETERLLLRPTAAEDLDGWAELMATRRPRASSAGFGEARGVVAIGEKRTSDAAKRVTRK